MKKIIVLLAVLFITTFSYAQGIIGLFGKSQDFFTLLQEQKFMEAHAFFDDSVKTKIAPENLQKLWTQLNENLGAFEAADVVQSKTEGDYFSVFLEGKFAKDTQNFLLVFNKSEKMVGLFLPPKSKAAAYQRPAYADSTLYTEKEIYVETPGHKLVGQLTLPKNGSNFPIVVFVHGSGPGDMDQTVGPNKPFKDLAAGLAAKGVASIRYVKRTLVYAGDFSKTFTVKEEVLDDAVAALALAKATPGINKKKVFLFGHSLGGMLAPRIATLVPDLSGIIISAAPARKLADVIIDQNKYMFALSKDTTEAMRTRLKEVIAELEKGKISKLGEIKPDSALIGLPASYWVDLNQHNQVSIAQKLKQRIMVIQGGNDYQITETDYNLWNAALSKKKNATLKLYPDLNHLLTPQTEKGTAAQYQIPANVSETLINDLAAWMKQ